jgi:hypothetical protein
MAAASAEPSATSMKLSMSCIESTISLSSLSWSLLKRFSTRPEGLLLLEHSGSSVLRQGTKVASQECYKSVLTRRSSWVLAAPSRTWHCAV